MKNNSTTLLDLNFSEGALEKPRGFPGQPAQHYATCEIQLPQVGPRLLAGRANAAIELAPHGLADWVDEEPARLQHIKPQVVECIQELSHANEVLRETQSQLTAQAADLQNQLAKRNAQIKGQLETMDTVRWVLAHVLRGPVRSISSFAELLHAENADTLNANGSEYLARVTQAAARLDSLIQDLLEFGNLSQTALSCENISLDSTLCKVVGDLAGEIALKSAELDIQRGLPRVWGHSGRLQEVVTHLLDNALKFVAPEIAPRIRIWAEQRSDRVRLWIQDNGNGVPAEERERIFELFHRMDDKYPGNGVGLAIVRKGMEQMGGEAGVEPAADGSRFWIDLCPAQRTQTESSFCTHPGPAHEPHNKLLASP